MTSRRPAIPPPTTPPSRSSSARASAPHVNGAPEPSGAPVRLTGVAADQAVRWRQGDRGMRVSTRLGQASLLACSLLLAIGCSMRTSGTPAGQPSNGASPAPAAREPSTGPSSIPSGIEGVTEAGPQCPSVSPGAACPDKAISATVAVLDPTGTEIARFTSSADGAFRIALQPGTYTLTEIVSVAGTPPSLKPTRVSVLPGQYVRVALLFDTGIR